MPHRTTAVFQLAGIIAALALSGLALAQRENPVYIDDSPQAWELFRQAEDQTRNNASEAVRLYQELLDEFGHKLIPVSGAATDHYTAVRLRVLAALRSDQALLERYRLIQTPQAQRMLEAAAAGQNDKVLQDLAATRSLTEPGLEALLILAQQDFESARFYSALQRLDEAADHPDLFAGAPRRAAHCAFMTAMAAHYADEAERFDAAVAELAELGREAEPFRKQIEQLFDSPALRVENLPTPGSESRATRPAAPQITTGVSGLDIGSAGDLNDLVAQTIWSVPLEDPTIRREARGFDQSGAIAEAIAEELFEAPGRRIVVGGNAGQSQNPRRGDQPTVMATAAGANVYVLHGQRVIAINRLTGHTLWTYSATGRTGGNTGGAGFGNEEFGGMGSMPVEMPDLGVVAVSGDSVVISTSTGAVMNRLQPGRIICLDANTGSHRWSTPLSGLLEGGGEDLFPHGVPLIAEGMVFIAARRIALQSLASAYVVALDLAGGQVRWVRYITSSGGLRPVRPFCTIAHDRGSIYMASTLGAIARMDASTGQVRWLHRFTVPVMMYGERRPWEVLAPVITRRGVLSLAPDQRRIVLMDTDTGDVLENYSAVGNASGDWNLPRYLLCDGRRVFAVGNEIRAFDLDALDQPLWRLPDKTLMFSDPDLQDAQPSRTNAAAANPMAAMEIRGRVHLADDALIIPTPNEMLIVDASTGRQRPGGRLAIQPTGNPLAMQSQLLVASSAQVDSFMSFARAQAMLRERIAQAPAEPQPALSLLRLALRGRDFSLALESADLALKAIDRLSAASPSGGADPKVINTREELFSLLLEVAASGVASTRAQGETLHATIASAATTPPQRIEHLLAYGHWLSQYDLPRCVETYQAILTNRSLAQSPREESGVTRPASDWATQRLAQLIEQRGPAAYAPQADFAQRRVRQTLELPGVPSEKAARLLDVALEFPLAEAAMDAAIQAADLHVASGNPRAALAGLARAHLAAPRRQTAARLLAEYARICSDAGWRDDARIVLQSIINEFGDLRLALRPEAGPAHTATRDAAQWLATLDEQLGTRPRPANIGVHADDATPLAGSIVTAARHDNVPMPADRTLLRDGAELKLIAAADLKPVWPQSAQITDIDPALLRFNSRDILLWQSAPARPPAEASAQAVMIEAATGETRWSTANLMELFAELDPAFTRLGGQDGAAAAARDSSPQRDDAVPLMFDANQLLPMVNTASGGKATLVVVHRAGWAIGLNLSDGREIRWRQKLALDRVHAAAMTDSALVLAGTIGGSGPRLVVLDPLTGKPAGGGPAEGSPLASRSPVRWLKLAAPGMAVVGSAEGIEALDIHAGQQRWSNFTYPAMTAQRAHEAHGMLVLEGERSRLRSLSAASGVISAPFEPSVRGGAEADALELREVLPVDRSAAPQGRAQIAAMYRQRLVVYDLASGIIVGSDAITDDRDYRGLLMAQDRMLLINSQPMQAQIGNQGARQTRYFYRVYQLTENGKIMASPLALPPLPQRLYAGGIIDGWLLVSTPSQTLAVPMMGE